MYVFFFGGGLHFSSLLFTAKDKLSSFNLVCVVFVLLCFCFCCYIYGTVYSFFFIMSCFLVHVFVFWLHVSRLLLTFKGKSKRKKDPTRKE